MVNYIKKKWPVFFVGLPMSLVLFPWLIIYFLTSLNEFNLENKLILKANQEINAILIDRDFGAQSSYSVYCFKAETGKKYRAPLSPPLIRGKLPKLGDQVRILIHPELDSCLIKTIKDDQIFSYKAVLIAYLVIAWLCFILVELMIVVIFLDMFGKIKNK
ncbi:hypothetical protein E4O04_10320 [Treponema sp. OMZ 799]|uniref:hypothetical protein n=1 Tax=Treponema sp. OMZ 799 TaxID=2563668 RepID=UPI0020A30F6D|nr:hypothetical protein [Treponema sp. OMZ 799]UTC78376.1 hypothetical protein E4O04_10320 [Treponema sp. OMZ 799]